MAHRIFPSWDQMGELPDKFTAGEIALARFLDKYLPEEWKIYIQPFLNGHRPDIIVFNPSVGITIIEVKDWNLVHYHFAQDTLFVSDSKGSYPIKNPVYQVEQYRENIIGQLIPDIGEKVDKTINALGLIKTGLYFHNATTASAKELFKDFSKDYRPIFGHDELKAENLFKIIPDSNKNSSFYWKKEWNNDILFWLDPPFHTLERTIPLDLTSQQKNHAEPKSGHFRLRGVAGSGKTQVIAFRAAKLASQGFDVLIVTFNITLWHYIKDLIQRAPFQFDWKKITFKHFHGFCSDILNEIGVDFPQGEGDDFFRIVIPSYVEEALEKSGINSKRYDAILIDEGQDFCLEWYKLLVRFLRDRNELLLVCDKKQNIYGVELSWIDGSLKGKGTQFRGDWRKLETVFRLPEKVAIAAEKFSLMFNLNQELKTERIVQQSLFERPLNPHIVWLNVEPNQRLKLIWYAFNQLKEEGYKASDMVILLPNHKIGMECVNHFESKNIYVNHVFDTDNESSRYHKKSFWMGDSRIKMSTIHSFKGWEILNVVLYIDDTFWGDNSQLDAVIYTAITRTRENLIVFNAHPRYIEFGNILPTKWNEQ
ncbi:UvrD-helicase domain-containing protein [Dolichospermum sp. UHCC 0684]|uniref:UvrD-helicase domain-containing protein n=1 Tax=Nostocales TaxID=1161 RepID=UPI00029B77B7|nr:MULTISPECIES: UvrD-helicase domain-containing protein [Nostocales]AFW94987.1 hypothetical protein ANA_C12250 [Anabaena sp. 90]MEA5531475.1 UvrD-helicase domain-containing protein [Dolichospermum sp. UHCC 0684]MTJ34390.1 AAA family ATPase [Dolichospermum sp. UHCC 0260]